MQLLKILACLTCSMVVSSAVSSDFVLAPVYGRPPGKDPKNRPFFDKALRKNGTTENVGIWVKKNGTAVAAPPLRFDFMATGGITGGNRKGQIIERTTGYNLVYVTDPAPGTMSNLILVKPEEAKNAPGFNVDKWLPTEYYHPVPWALSLHGQDSNGKEFRADTLGVVWTCWCDEVNGPKEDCEGWNIQVCDSKETCKGDMSYLGMKKTEQDWW